MIKFDEATMLKNGASIYEKRAEIETIAEALHEMGYRNLLFSSSGGSQAMMDPFAELLREHSDIPVLSVLSSTLVLTGHNEIDKDTIVFMASKSGDTPDTLAAAKYLKGLGCNIVSIIGKAQSPLEAYSDFHVVYEDGRPQELILYILLGKLMYCRGCFPKYPQFAEELKHLPQVLVDVRKQADEQAISYCKAYHKEPYNIWIASGDLYPVCYAYAMCVLEESQWIRTKSVSSPEFFHGTLELIEKDVCVTLLITEGKTRPLDLRVKKFIETYSDKANVFDCHDYAYKGISDEFRPLLSCVVMNAILQRISKNMEHVTKHDLDIRRYYRTVSY